MYNSNIKYTMEEIRTKVCKCCGEELPVTSFYEKKTSADGYQTYCKSCQSKKMVEYARNRREKEKARKVEAERVEFDKKYKVYTNRELAKFQPRELMLELKARGYEGELVFREVKITEHRINLSKLE